MTDDTGDPRPWYHEGLNFTCTRCGHCCTGEPGVVWVTDEEVNAIAAFRKEDPGEVTAAYTRKTRGRRTLRERANGDCVFFEAGKGCTIYPVRPPQCRTWPFWESNVESPEAWEQTQKACPGSRAGELIPVEEISRRVRVIRM